jgi:bifunctional oligoribonuclease and PAP phosphatase NrnA
MPVSQKAFQEMAAVFQARETFLLIPHDRADGDAMGSMLALARGLESHGKKAFPVMLSEVSERYRFLFEGLQPVILNKNLRIEDLPAAEAVVLIDTGGRQQLLPIMPYLEKRPGKLIVIDHHAHGDIPTDYKLTDESSPATGLLIGKLLEQLGWLADPKIAEYLLVAIACDTGWFSYSNTNAECFSWAGKLAELGADSRGIYEKLFLSESVPRYRLLAQALASTELRAADRLVAMTLRQRDFADCGADQAHTENLIDQACRLKSMVVGILFVEQPQNVVRISLRSRDPFDVHQFAARFGGGGHRHAAGMRVNGEFEDVRTKVLAELETQLVKTY